jgi:UV DNA damage endonuclease
VIRLGLCCLFVDAPIRFRTTTATATRKRGREAGLAHIAGLCRENARSLSEAVAFCADRGIGAFRINSRILPVRTHPEVGYAMAELPGGPEIAAAFRECGNLARKRGVRLSFHPDQFVLLNSPKPDVVRHSLAELAYQAEVAEWVGADAINIHGGGGYGDKPAALERLVRGIEALPDAIRKRLTLENDDRVFSPADLLPVCRRTGTPLTYDIHHHRLLPDDLSTEAATERALETWDREPLFHISSPIEGWTGPHPNRHRDFVDPTDFPDSWRDLDLAVDVEAKAKERAVLALREALERSGARLWPGKPENRYGA